MKDEQIIEEKSGAGSPALRQDHRQAACSPGRLRGNYAGLSAGHGREESRFRRKTGKGWTKSPAPGRIRAS